MTLSNFAKDAYIAPGVSAFTHAEIPDMSSYASQSKHWISNFFLNSMLRANIKAPYRAYLFNYFRRAEGAFREHDLARTATLDFLASSGQSPAQYSVALFHWEIFLGQAWHAFKILEKAFKFTLYKGGEGSVEERFNRLYNQMKHVESRIACGQILENATVPVWIMRDGLQSVDISLSYVETAEVLKDVAKWADILMDPLTIREKLGA